MSKTLPDPSPHPLTADRTRLSAPHPMRAVAAAAFLAALGSCDSDPVVEPVPSLEIVPDSVTLAHLGQEFAFTVRGEGAVRWSSQDAEVATVDANGTVTARGNGLARVQAWTPASSDQATVRVRQAAAALEPFGDGQRTTPAQPLLEPVGVRVLDAGGAPATGAAVRFEPGPGSGQVEPREAASDSAGVAMVEWTLGPQPGRQVLRAVAPEGGASVEIAATALDPDEAAASWEVRSGEDQWALAGHALPDPVAVRVLDEAGRPVPRASVRFEPEAGSGRADPDGAATDSAGLASTVWTLGDDRLGAQRLVVSVADKMTLAFEATAVSDEGVCNRTPAVSAEIARQAAGVGHCSEVTEEMLGGVRRLILVSKGITRLEDRDFVGLVGLEELNLSDNLLTDLAPGIFSGLSRLRRLVLASNQLTELTHDVFSGLSRLEELNFWRNRITELTPGTFADLVELESLRFDHNELTELQSDLFEGLSGLRSLTMRGNQLASLPDGIFDDLPRLEYLVVGDNRLKALTPGLFAEMPDLRRIALDGNELTELSPGLLSETAALERLYLQGNNLTGLPPGIFDRLPNLIRLDLSGNYLVDLSQYAFAGTPDLAQLSLDYNELVELPPGLFAGLSDLEWITLQGNPGAPFPVRPEYVRVDGDLLARGPARVVLGLPLGAPFAFTVPVSVQRGSISRESVLLLPGDTISAVFEVSANRDGGAVHLGFPSIPQSKADGYEGLQVVRGDELVLFAETDNRSPGARSVVPAHRLQAGGPSADLVLADYFDDPDGDSLAYAVETAESGVVAARIEDGVLWLDPMSVDTTQVEVTATDPGGLRATQQFLAWVVPAPDPDAFNIELHFGPGFTAEEESAIRRAVDRWMDVVTGDLPDVPMRRPLDEGCFGGSPPPRVVGVIDDLLIHMRFVARQGSAAATARTCGIRESGRAFLGESSFSLWYARNPDPVLDRLHRSALHEIGHILGFGDWKYTSAPQAWQTMFQGRGTDPHFTGPLAVAAFNAAGGEAYSGVKVPLEDIIPTVGIHWRQRVIPGEVMAPSGDALLTAITVQTLADLGYEVDLSKADPYTLPGQAQADAQGADADAEVAVAELFADDVIRGPVVVVDGDGKVVRVIRP